MSENAANIPRRGKSHAEKGPDFSSCIRLHLNTVSVEVRSHLGPDGGGQHSRTGRATRWKGPGTYNFPAESQYLDGCLHEREINFCPFYVIVYLRVFV